MKMTTSMLIKELTKAIEKNGDQWVTIVAKADIFTDIEFESENKILYIEGFKG